MKNLEKKFSDFANFFSHPAQYTEVYRFVKDYGEKMSWQSEKEARAYYKKLLAEAKKQFDKDLLQMKAEYYSRKKTPNTHLPDEDCDKSCTHRNRKS